MILKRAMWAFALLLAALGLAPDARADKAHDTLVWSTERELNVPLVWWDSVVEVAAMMHLMCDTLVYRDPDDYSYKPLLAKSWTWVDDKTLEFKLRDDVKFHDGTPFTANDVAATYNALLNPDAKVLNAALINWMSSVEAVDPTTVRIKMKAPFPAALEFLSGTRMGILPAKSWENLPKNASGQTIYTGIKPIGTGPYVFDKFVAGQTMELVKNKAYFNGAKGQPSINRLVFKTIPDQETRIAELMVGNIDWITDVPHDKVAELKAMPDIAVVEGADMRVGYLQFDVIGREGETPVKNLKVRQAIAHAIDRGAIAKNLIGGGAMVMNAACYPTQVGCTDDVQTYAYDPAKARALLKEAGYPNGFSIDIYAYRDKEYAEAVIGYLKAVGIQAKLNFLQYAALRDKVQKEGVPLTLLLWGSSGLNDASAFVSVWFKHGPDDLCRDPDVKASLDAADKEMDPAKRKDFYKAALQKIQSNLCWLPMYSYSKAYAYAAGMEFKPTADGFPLFYLAKWKK